jgi:hypothetical protein
MSTYHSRTRKSSGSVCSQRTYATNHAARAGGRAGWFCRALSGRIGWQTNSPLPSKAGCAKRKGGGPPDPRRSMRGQPEYRLAGVPAPLQQRSRAAPALPVILRS